jgi:hypothetical protein
MRIQPAAAGQVSFFRREKTRVTRGSFVSQFRRRRVIWDYRPWKTGSSCGSAHRRGGYHSTGDEAPNKAVCPAAVHANDAETPRLNSYGGPGAVGNGNAGPALVPDYYGGHVFYPSVDT